MKKTKSNRIWDTQTIRMIKPCALNLMQPISDKWTKHDKIRRSSSTIQKEGGPGRNRNTVLNYLVVKPMKPYWLLEFAKTDNV